MEIRFDPTPTGGACMTGCHPPRRYDREHPVDLMTPLLPFAASPRAPVADSRKQVIANFTARDIRGNEVRVPADDKAGVLLFLRNGQLQSLEAAGLMTAMPPVLRAAQVVVVFCGEQADERARGFKPPAGADWRIVADADQGLSKALGVEGWPATLVVRPDGAVVAHIGGASPSLTLELKAYLELAGGRIDREALGERLAQLARVVDGPAKRAAWHLQMGRKLLDDGETEKARAMFADGLQLQPDSFELKLELVRSLVDLKQAKPALDLLGELPADAMAGWERKLLRARARAIQGQWDETRRLAGEVLEEAPEHGAAHFLMGQIHEHAGEWEKAAQAYRKAHSQPSR
jgi:tetratricopeptide (TPR) repeat protein